VGSVVRCAKCGSERPLDGPCPKCLLPAYERLGPYRIVSLLGSGAMGEVYRARDDRLAREVAIKVLPARLAHEPERIARFRREARLAASLNHPNIAAIYGFEDVDDTHFLVMELVEGLSLADRLRSGPIPIDETLSVVAQIAEGLEAAHETGVVHRDLKPSNVMLLPDGKVKILDFGLAKALDTERAVQDLGHSPSILATHTTPGAVIGTVPYMSPSKRADGRSIGAPTSGRSGACCTSASRADAPSRGKRRRTCSRRSSSGTRTGMLFQPAPLRVCASSSYGAWTRTRDAASATAATCGSSSSGPAMLANGARPGP
jgi:serine/threonine protein kinase